ncbi:hypothetical protein FD01_GL000514 [Lacticaseibacillus manihotivorans DSM 13343 = JCM 12514]|uniref:Uncharacterized protein n=1 Tax=Lacticaseibacillus manihotivorans DSM 13343 = JCM 12514 TaxID=1423769 RepID=A0A0R1QMU3_9LACO|nr:hypothetical protein FD01_GL000514 [Lacticaseibacillus manihotivorans DSM 13343 = JCM 12514]
MLGLTTHSIDADLECEIDASTDDSPHGDMGSKLIWQGDAGASKLSRGINQIP